MANKKNTTGVLLVNLGTPDSPSVPDVRKYLREFLMDGRVIDIPLVARAALVNLIIAPFRAPKSAKTYQKLWTERGSPLLYYGQDITQMLQEELGESYAVELAMRYQSPSIENGLKALMKKNVSRLIIVPLFPQYASATTGSVQEKVMELVKGWQVVPTMHFISNFVEEPLFIEAWKQVATPYLEKEYDHYVFSYHGVPERHIRKSSVDGYCQLNGKCCSTYNKKNQYCYRGQCFYTTRQLAESLNIPEEKYTVCFQSRLGTDPWIKPYAETVIKELAEEGHKKVLAFSPAFIADCLETTVEVGEEFRDEFIEEGGEEWTLVESLNAHPAWVQCLKKMVLDIH